MAPGGLARRGKSNVGFVFLKKMVESFKIVERRRCSKIKYSRKRIAKYEVIICSAKGECIFDDD